MSSGVSYSLGPILKVFVGGQPGGWNEYPVLENTLVETHNAVGVDSNGYARALQAGDVFVGFARETADNRIGDHKPGLSGEINVQVKAKGQVVADIAGLTVSDNNQTKVYMSDENTFTLSSSGNTLIGFVSSFRSTGVGIVEFDSSLQQ